MRAKKIKPLNANVAREVFISFLEYILRLPEAPDF